MTSYFHMAIMLGKPSPLECRYAARDLSRSRRRLIDRLLADGFSQADVARELGVTRQAIQKMMAAGQDEPSR